ncbi:uncharacterized protein ACN63O_022885 [Diretmus argenteus]
MESGTASRAEGQTGPPALPIKQRRSQFSRSSSVDSDCGMFIPLGLQHHSHTCHDVFSDPTDCHAAQCPIHQRYDHFHGHQERFFSDGIPPPVPKKRLARALSLPGDSIPPPSPLFPTSPLQLHSHAQNFDNPLYMLTPIRDTRFLEEREDVKPVKRSPVPSPSLSQLSFDTPDEDLPYLFSSFDDHRVVSQGIQHRHLLFLRSVAQGVEAGILLPGEASDRDVSSYRPQDFLLCEGHKPKQIGDALYYSLHSPKFPRRVLSARKGYSVSVERDLPQATLEDFIQESRPLQSSEPLLYERQNETSGLQMADMAVLLQVLLWGPHARFFKFNYNSSTTTSVHNWLSIKRALLVMKLAEKGLIQDQSALDWEDCLCLQYLSFTDSETVTRVTDWPGLALNIG